MMVCISKKNNKGLDFPETEETKRLVLCFNHGFEDPKSLEHVYHILIMCK